jgi:hypothetical protein
MSTTMMRRPIGPRPRRTNWTRTRWPTSNWRLLTVLTEARTSSGMPSRRSSIDPLERFEHRGRLAVGAAHHQRHVVALVDERPEPGGQSVEKLLHGGLSRSSRGRR